MTLFTILYFIVAVALITAHENDWDDLADDADRMAWIDFLARESRKGHRTSRTRYAKSGIMK